MKIFICLILFFYEISTVENNFFCGSIWVDFLEIRKDCLIDRLIGKWKITSSVKFSTMASVSEKVDEVVVINKKQILFYKYILKSKTTKLIHTITFSKILVQQEKFIEFVNTDNVIWRLTILNSSAGRLLLENIGDLIDDEKIYLEGNTEIELKRIIY